MMAGLIILRFQHSYGVYNPGEKAGFQVARAAEILKFRTSGHPVAIIYTEAMKRADQEAEQAALEAEQVATAAAEAAAQQRLEDAEAEAEADAEKFREAHAKVVEEERLQAKVRERILKDEQKAAAKKAEKDLKEAEKTAAKNRAKGKKAVERAKKDAEQEAKDLTRGE